MSLQPVDRSPARRMRLVCRSVDAVPGGVGYRVGLAGEVRGSELAALMIDADDPETLPRVGRVYDLTLSDVSD